jgi:hypothetical protein
MTDRRTGQEQWWVTEDWIENTQISRDLCISELRSRVEDLEIANRRLRIEVLRLSNAVARQLPDRDKFFLDLLPDHENENQ